MKHIQTPLSAFAATVITVMLLGGLSMASERLTAHVQASTVVSAPVVVTTATPAKPTDVTAPAWKSVVR